MAKQVNIGQTFGAWTVEADLGYNQKWKVRCECGTEGKVRVYDLLRGTSTMCKACSASLESSSNRSEEDDSAYSSWCHAKARCLNPDNKDYPNYGGRGITMHPLWVESFDAFLIMMPGKKPGDTIERLDYNGNYEPGNCIWLSREQQPRNQRSNQHLTAFGETKLLSDWVRDPRCAVPQSTLYRRFHANKLTPEDMITQAARSSKTKE